MLEKLEYEKYQKLNLKYQRIVGRLANIRLILFILMILSFILKYYYYEKIFQVIFILSLISFVIMVIVHDKYYQIYDYYSKYMLVLEQYVNRLNGKWKEFPDTGIDFDQNDKAYLRDLDIIGNCSLFQYLSVCKTLGGRERLFHKLSDVKISAKRLKEHQEAIKELASCISFGIDFQISMMEYENKNVYLSEKCSLFQVNFFARKIEFFIGCIFSFLSILFLSLGLLKVVSLKYFYGIFLFNFIISLFYSYLFRKEFRTMDSIIQSYAKLKGVFLNVVSFSFVSSLLKDIQQNMRDGLGYIEKLSKFDTVNSLRNNFLGNFVFNGLCCVNLIQLYQFSKSFSGTLEDFKKSILDIEELESLISVASLGVVRDHKCMPVMSQEIGINFMELQHPLLDEKICVPNDFSTSAGIDIITGSNMGGKTSFMRTVGVNLILMYAGGYVCASSFEASYFKIFTSMRIADDIEKGISTFYGELLRIKDAIDYVDKGNMLVLIDEIFKGTNYQDRIYGACEVIERLNTEKTITFITTHDFELCEVDNVRNYHVQEYYEGDKICFDYKIRKGKCVSTNAKYLMKKLGIIQQID